MAEAETKTETESETETKTVTEAETETETGGRGRDGRWLGCGRGGGIPNPADTRGPLCGLPSHLSAGRGCPMRRL